MFESEVSNQIRDWVYLPAVERLNAVTDYHSVRYDALNTIWNRVGDRVYNQAQDQIAKDIGEFDD